MKFIDVYEPPAPLTRHCFICGGGDDGHWSDCIFAPEGANADTDPDADLSEQSAELY